VSKLSGLVSYFDHHDSLFSLLHGGLWYKKMYKNKDIVCLWDFKFSRRQVWRAFWDIAPCSF
jgi:hypothetical protein